MSVPAAVVGRPCACVIMIVMAQKTVVVLVDNLDGDPADTTVRFGLDSREYELDLTEANAQALREAFARYIPAARKTSGGRRASTTAEKPAKAFQGFDPAAVRACAAGKCCSRRRRRFCSSMRIGWPGTGRSTMSGGQPARRTRRCGQPSHPDHCSRTPRRLHLAS